MRKKIGIWVIGSFAFLASVATVLDYVDVKPWHKIETKDEIAKEEPKPKQQEPKNIKKTDSKHMSQESKNINITSNHQSGGITAQTVIVNQTGLNQGGESPKP
jgi:hypothetical protein